MQTQKRISIYYVHAHDENTLCIHRSRERLCSNT